jgi:3',5'-cyclic AMP phosphodiesterase CpdA
MDRESIKRTFTWSVVVFIIAITFIKLNYDETFPEIEDWNQDQLDEIDTSQEEFSFAVYGDNRGSHDVFETLLSDIDDDPDILFAMNLGDLVDSGLKENWRLFIEQIQEVETPTLMVPGNHDIQNDGGANYRKFFGPMFYSFTVGNTYFITLDSSTADLDDEQKTWLESELVASSSYDHRFVALHHPLYDPRGGEECAVGYSLGEELADELEDLFAANNVSMVLAGHIHAYYEGRCGGVPYIITGGAGAPLDGVDPEHDFYHWIKVTVTEEGFTTEVMKVEPPESDVLEFFNVLWVDITRAVSACYLGLVVLPLVLLYLIRKDSFK